MQWSQATGEWSDLSVRAISSDAASDRCPRQPPWQRREETDEDIADDESFDLNSLIADSVTLGDEDSDESPAPTCPLSLARLTLRPLAVDLATCWTALVGASALQPRFRLRPPVRRFVSWRRLRRSTRIPLGVPVTPCEAVLSSHIADE